MKNSARRPHFLAWLRDELGDQFVVGAVLHTGQWSFPLDERITAVPIASPWGTGDGAAETGL